MRFKQYIIERSFSNCDIPNDFWVVFDIKDILNELKSGKIKGLKGISSSSDIQFDFLGVARDAMLQMDSTKLLKINKITRIMYNNPHYLVSKNLWALRRIFNARSSNWVDQVFGNVFERFEKALKSYKKYSQLSYDMGYYGIRNVDYKWSKSYNPKIDNIKDFAKIVKYYIENIFSEKTGVSYDMSLSDLQKILYDILLSIGEVYQSENEWVIKNDYLIVPDKSILYILTVEPTNFNQTAYDIVKANPKVSNLDMFEVFALFRDAGIEHLTKDINIYKKVIEFDDIKDKLGNKYVIKKLDINEFKAKQAKFWNKNT